MFELEASSLDPNSFLGFRFEVWLPIERRSLCPCPTTHVPKECVQIYAPKLVRLGVQQKSFATLPCRPVAFLPVRRMSTSPGQNSHSHFDSAVDSAGNFFTGFQVVQSAHIHSCCHARMAWFPFCDVPSHCVWLHRCWLCLCQQSGQFAFSSALAASRASSVGRLFF